MSDKEPDFKGAGADFRQWARLVAAAFEGSLLVPFTALAAAFCFGYSLYGAWFAIYAGDISGWSEAWATFGKRYGENFLFSTMVSWLIMSIVEVFKMGNFLFMGLVRLFRLDKLRDWVLEQEAADKAKIEAADKAKIESAKAEGYQEGFRDGEASVLNRRSGGD